MATVTAKRETGKHLFPSALAPTTSVLARLSPSDREFIGRTLDEPSEYVPESSYKRRSTERVLFPPPEAQSRRSVAEMLGDARGRSSAMSTMTTEEERHAFHRYNYARYRVNRVLRRNHGRRLTLAGSKEYVLWQRRALAGRSHIVQANLPLVLAMAKRTRLGGVDYNELISEGNVALLRSVAKFDCSRGFKFSTYACRAILKSFSRVAVRTARYRCRFPTEYDPSLEKSDLLDVKREVEAGDCMSELRGVLNQNLADLSDVEWTVINSRFALNARADEKPAPKTLEQVGAIIGVTKERVRQIQNKALRKLRAALEESIVAA